MVIGDKKAVRLLLVLFAVFLIAFAANALIDLGAVIHDLTHNH